MRKLTSEERKRLAHAFAGARADVGELRSAFEAAAERLRAAEADERRRRAGLRRLTFGLLGR
ncbi:MAG: hypothetical protein RMM28_11935 [Thermoleophilia bacterium]|nr:hypothetical protein [Gaiellaceae bacterium]MDW8339837.1 hypothetical protein [Thermoleophilia bacterium]